VNNSGAPAGQNTGSAVQNDDHLFITLGANETWDFEAFIIATSTASNPDIKVTFTAPTGAGTTLIWTAEKQEGANLEIASLVTASGTERNFTIGANATIIFRVKGVVATAGTAGSLQFRWAQNTAHGTSTTVLANSFLKATKLN